MQVLLSQAHALLFAGVWTALAGSIAVAEPRDIRTIFEEGGLNRCGPLALQACANFLDVPVRAQDVARHLPNDGRVTTFSQLRECADALGLATAPVRWTGRPLLPRSGPAILAIEFKGSPHFLAAVGRRGDRVLVIDFPDAAWMNLERLRNEYHWNGEALHVANSKPSIAWLYVLLYGKQIILALVSFAVLLLLVKRLCRRRLRVNVSHQLEHTAFGLACAACLGFSAGCSRGFTSGDVRLEPNPVILDLSNSTADKVETLVHVVNNGHEALRIRRVVASCACTMVGEPTTVLITPGERAGIRIAGHPPSTGERRSHLVVFVDSESGQRRLSATVLLRGRSIQAPAIVKVPDEVVLRCDANGDAKDTVLVRTFENSHSSPWIRSVTANRPTVTVRLHDMQEADSSERGITVRDYFYSLEARRVSYNTGKRVQTPASISLTSADSDVPVARFYVRLEEWRPFRLVPRMLFFDQSDTIDGPLKREIRVVSSDTRFHPTGVDTEVSASWINVTSLRFDDSGDSWEALITIELQRERMPRRQAIHGSVTVRALRDQDGPAEESVPIVVKMRPPVR